MGQITDEAIVILSQPNWLMKLLAYFFLPLGVLLLLALVWSKTKGEANDWRAMRHSNDFI